MTVTASSAPPKHRVPAAAPRETSRPVEVLERTQGYDGHYSLDVWTVRHGLFEGGMSAPLKRECLERGHAVGMLLVDPVAECLLMIEQFRIGGYAAGMDPWQWEIPAGIIEDGEDPAEVAARETMEETGCAVSDLFRVFQYLASPGCSSESVTLYCGRVDTSNLGGTHGLDEEGEDIRVFALPFDQIEPAFAEGRMTNSLLVIAMQWFLLNRDSILKRWR